MHRTDDRAQCPAGYPGCGRTAGARGSAPVRTRSNAIHARAEHAEKALPGLAVRPLRAVQFDDCTARAPRNRAACEVTLPGLLRPLALLLAVQLAACASQPTVSDAARDERAERPAFHHPCDAVRPEDEPLVDDTQALLEETGCRAALWLDGLFGGEPSIAAARRTRGYVETSGSYSQFEGFDTRTRLRVRFDLPNLEERVSAFFGLDDEEEFIQDRSEGFALRSQFPRIDDRDEWLAGLGYSLPRSERLQTDFKIGASNLRRPRAFVRARVHYNLYADRFNLVYLRVTPFWRTRDGVGVTFGIDYNHVLAPALLLRYSNVGTIGETTQGTNWLSALILYQNLREERAMAYELFVRGDTGAAEPLHEYGGRLIYRHPLVRRKLYGELIGGYSWPRIDPAEPRRGSYEVGLGLELPFGQHNR